MAGAIEDKRTRKRKTDPKVRNHIATMYNSGEFTMIELAEMFQVSQPRISQIVKEQNGSNTE
jgi:DNA-binding transcriptional regulator GbsR (MarR family)